jgi:hypothetical protein
MRGGVFLEANPRAKFIQLNYLNDVDKEPISFIFEQWFERGR